MTKQFMGPQVLPIQADTDYSESSLHLDTAVAVLKNSGLLPDSLTYPLVVDLQIDATFQCLEPVSRARPRDKEEASK